MVMIFIFDLVTLQTSHKCRFVMGYLSSYFHLGSSKQLSHYNWHKITG